MADFQRLAVSTRNSALDLAFLSQNQKRKLLSVSDNDRWVKDRTGLLPKQSLHDPKLPLECRRNRSASGTVGWQKTATDSLPGTKVPRRTYSYDARPTSVRERNALA